MSVCIGTFGDHKWVNMARDRAIPSVPDGVPLIHEHREGLASARNAALAKVETEWVIHLDADDELAPNYVEAMASGVADLRAPAVSYVKNGRPRPSYVPQVAGHDHACTAECLSQGNWLVIGTAVRTELLREAGGWKDWAVYEDWDAFWRCHLAGGTVEALPQAIYIAHVRFDSRNRAPSMEEKNRVHYAIVEANMPQVAA